MKKNYNVPFMAVIPMMPFAAVMAGSGGGSSVPPTELPINNNPGTGLGGGD